MGKFDKQVKEATRIADGWKRESEDFAARFQSIKKDSLALEKTILKQVQAGVQANKHTDPQMLQHYKSECATILDRLSEFKKAGERIYKEHDTWALKEPRASMRTFSAKLKLGKPGDEAYDAVSEGTKRTLTDVAATLKTTQGVWNRDVSFAIDTQISKVEAVQKILAGDQNKHSAFITQIRKEAKAYEAMCKKSVVAATSKLSSDAKDLPAAQTGALKGEDPKKLQQKHQLYGQRRDQMKPIMDILEKNHKRVLKSVPKSFIDGFMTSKEKADMEKAKTDALLKIKQAEKLYERLVSEFEKQSLV